MRTTRILDVLLFMIGNYGYTTLVGYEIDEDLS